MGCPFLRTAEAPPPLPPSGLCASLCQGEGAGARRGGGDGITPMPGGERRTQRSPMGEAPALGGGERLRGRRGGWLARSKDQDQSHPGQEAPSETLRATPADGRRGSRWARVGDWQGADAPSHPTATQMLGSSTRRKGGWGRALTRHLCLRSGLAQPSAPAKAGPGREPQDLGGDSGKQPQHQMPAGGGTPVGRGSPHSGGGSFRLSN